MKRQARRSPAPRPSPLDCHHEQEAPDSCVAACVCMVKKWRGDVAKEAVIRERLQALSVEGLKTAAMEFGWKFQWVDWDEVEEREACLGNLSRGVWIIVDVYPGHLTMHSEQLTPPPVSRHGPLMRRSAEDLDCKEDLSARLPQYPHHAIVLVEEVVGGFRYLDPWFPRKGQPFFMSRADLGRMWAGLAVIPENVR